MTLTPQCLDCHVLGRADYRHRREIARETVAAGSRGAVGAQRQLRGRRSSPEAAARRYDSPMEPPGITRHRRPFLAPLWVMLLAAAGGGRHRLGVLSRCLDHGGDPGAPGGEDPGNDRRPAALARGRAARAAPGADVRRASGGWHHRRALRERRPPLRSRPRRRSPSGCTARPRVFSGAEARAAAARALREHAGGTVLMIVSDPALLQVLSAAHRRSRRPPRRTIPTSFTSSAYRVSATRTWCASGCDRRPQRRALAPRSATGAQGDGAPDELLVLARCGNRRARRRGCSAPDRSGRWPGVPRSPSGPRTSYMRITNLSMSDSSVNGSWYFSLKARCVCRALRAHADDLQADLLDIIVQIADRAGLAGAAGGEVGRIEVQDQRARGAGTC